MNLVYLIFKGCICVDNLLRVYCNVKNDILI